MTNGKIHDASLQQHARIRIELVADEYCLSHELRFCQRFADAHISSRHVVNACGRPMFFDVAQHDGKHMP